MSTSSKAAEKTASTEPPQGTSPVSEPESTSRKIQRRRRKRLRKMPRPALPMRALWESASREQQEQAHENTVWMLEYWVGRMSKQEAAETMSVTPLRVWQLSQMAVAGMVCGLLPQPRYRKGMGVSMSDPQSDPKALQKRIKKLEADLASAQRLIDILKTLPGNASRAASGKHETPSGEKESSKTSRRVSSSGPRKARGRRS